MNSTTSRTGSRNMIQIKPSEMECVGCATHTTLKMLRPCGLGLGVQVRTNLLGLSSRIFNLIREEKRGRVKIATGKRDGPNATGWIR
jgi:hypothetical protein